MDFDARTKALVGLPGVQVCPWLLDSEASERFVAISN